MRRKVCGFILSLGLCILFSVIVSCSDVTDDQPQYSPKDTLEIYFLVDAAGKNTSRAYKYAGTEDESFVNLQDGDYRILLYNEEGKLIKTLSDSEIKFNGQNVSNIYPITKKELNDSKILYAAAVVNWKSFGTTYAYPDFGTQSFPLLVNLWTSDLKFSIPGDQTWWPSKAEKRLIPMFGLTKVDIERNTEIIDYQPRLRISIPVIRSLAKISFQVSDDLYESGFDMNECSMVNYNAGGFFIPNMSREGNKLKDNGEISVEDPSCPDQTRVSTPLIFRDEKGGNGKKRLVVYLPEMDNSSFMTGMSNRPHINASLAYEGEKFGEDKIIELSFYDSDGQVGNSSPLYNVVRNNFYEYTVVDIDKDQNLILKYTVCPWEKLETDIEFN